MGYKRRTTDRTTLLPSEPESDVQPEVDSSALQPTDALPKSPRPKRPRPAFHEKTNADSAPGTEYWLP